MTAEQVKALNSAADIMDTERQELSRFLEKLGSKLSVREDKTCQFSDAVPHRVEIAITNERDRLQGIARELRALVPRAIIPDEE